MTLDTIIDAVIVANGTGLILEYNRAAETMFGWTKDEVIGRQPLNVLMPHKFAKNHDRYMSEYRSGGTPKLIGVTRTLRGLRKDGGTFPVDVSLGQFPKEWLSNLEEDERVEKYLGGGLFVGTLRDASVREKEKMDWGGSRYKKEFEELEFLGKGGFGAVYRARNRLDGQEYAIKKIKLRCHPADYAMAMAALQSSAIGLGGSSVAGSTSAGEGSMGSVASAGSGSVGTGSEASVPKQGSESATATATASKTTAGSGTNTNTNTAGSATNTGSLSPDDLRIIREVKTFARISNHPNVVRYYNSWVEAVWEEGVSGSESEKEREERERRERENAGAPQPQVPPRPVSAKPETPPVPPPVPSRPNLAMPPPVPSSRTRTPIEPPRPSRPDTPPDAAEEAGDTIDLEQSTPDLPHEEDISRNFYTPAQMKLAEQDMFRRQLAKKRAKELEGFKVVLRTGSNEFERAEEEELTGSTDDSAEVSLLPAGRTGPVGGKVLVPPVPARPGGILDGGAGGGFKGEGGLLANPNPHVGAHGHAPAPAPAPKKKEKEDPAREGPSTILFIQMQLCSPSNLHKWLQSRNASRALPDSHPNLALFRQIVSGLAHVHAGGFIHRDIKPANVFLEGDHVFLGDFGLAKDISQRTRHPEAGEEDPLLDELLVRNPSSDEEGGMQLKEGWEDTVARKMAEGDAGATQTNLTLGVGTLLYASPEQLSRKRYDSKTDIYSLGVLFFELFWPFATPVERVYTLMELRKGIVPQGFKSRYPSEYALLKRMIATEPKERPTAIEILASDVMREHDAAVYRRGGPGLARSGSLGGHFTGYARVEQGRKRATSATGDGVSFAGRARLGGKGSPFLPGQPMMSPGPGSGSGSASSRKGRTRNSIALSDSSSARLRTQVGELMVGESSSGSSKPRSRRSKRDPESSSLSLPSITASDSTTSTETESTDSEEFGTDDGHEEATGSIDLGGGRVQDSERRRINAARFEAFRKRAADAVAGRLACVECKEKDIMIMALRERNRKLMDRVHELERELQVLRSGGLSVGLTAAPSRTSSRTPSFGAVGVPTGEIRWGAPAVQGREPPAVPARPGGFPRVSTTARPMPVPVPVPMPMPIPIPEPAGPGLVGAPGPGSGFAMGGGPNFGLIPRPVSVPPPDSGGRVQVTGRAPPAIPSRPGQIGRG